MGRVAPLMFIVDSTVQWCVSSDMCWVAQLDRFTLACGRTLSNWSFILLSMVGWVAPLVSVADSAPCWFAGSSNSSPSTLFFVCLFTVAQCTFTFTCAHDCIPDGLT